MTTYICVKTCGRFRMGKVYTFNGLTAQAGSAIRGGFLKPLATGGVVQAAPKAVGTEGTPDLVVPKKRGRPKKVSPVATKDIGGLE